MAENDRYSMRRVGWLRLFVIFVATANAFIVLYAPQPLLPMWETEFHISVATASLSISVTIFALALTSLVLAPYFDRWDRKTVMVSASALLVLPSLLLYPTESFEWLLVWRLLYGVFIPGITAVMMAYVSEEFPVEQRGRMMGTYISATVIGGLLGRLLSGGVAEFFSWRTVFLGIGLDSLVIAVFILLFLPKSKNQTTKRARGSIRVLLRNPSLLSVFFIGFSHFFAFIGFFTYIPFYLAASPFQLSVSQISAVYLTYLFGVISAPVGGSLSDRFGRRNTMAIGHGIAVMGILITLWPTLIVVIVGASILSLGAFAAQSVTTALVTDLALDAKGAATSLYLFFYYTGGSVGAWIPGVFWRQYGWRGLVSFTVGTLVLALVLNRLLGRSNPEKTSLH